MSTTHPHLPQIQVVRWSTPDSRKPWFKDYLLACGHVLVHRPLRRGADGRLHVARRMPCPHCSRPLAARPATAVPAPAPQRQVAG